DLVEEDTERYRAALEKTGGVFGGIEPVHRFYEAFQGPVDATHAAAAVGLETETFLQEILDKQRLRDLGLAGLLEDGDVSRDAWTSNFAQVISALNSPDDATTQPVEPGTDLRPGDLVSIPDPNLRTVIENLLGKAPGALITGADMARLTRIDADDAGISNLTGLEAAIELERIEFRRNAISDLSPLRGLTRLNNIKLRGNRITDVSPLAGLINVDWLGLEENEITDLSPLAGLVKLNGIGISGNPVSDVSPLAELISLGRIDAWRTPILDFAALAKLPRLSWIEFGNDRSISVLPSLRGLRNLTRLEIHNCNISDISGLAELTQLEWLELINNQVSDISPLANLKSLEHLNLDANVIEDVSPLAKLTRLELLYLENNKISDVSPLAGLTNLERLDLRNNAISDFSALAGLLDKTFVRMEGNAGSTVTSGGKKIEGPWLWIIASTGETGGASAAASGIDFLAQMSSDTVTEPEIAANGAIEGNPVGNKVWTIGNISATRSNNINDMVNATGLGAGDINNHVAYGFVSLDSSRVQNTTMLVGSDDAVKVWLNGNLVHNNPVDRGANNFQDQFPVTLKEGINILLVAVYEQGGAWSGFFGFAPDAGYTVLSPSTRFSLSTATTQVEVGDRFTVQLKAENISDLAGWQSDIVFDPAVLKVNNVSEGSFLKQSGGRSHFLKGTIDNTTGRIDGIGSARISEGGGSGDGTLLSITFTAIANGESRLSLRRFQAGSSLGETISARPPDMIITVGDPSVSDVSDLKFSLSTDADPIRRGDTFTLRLNANDVTDLAGWQTDISFDPALLEAVEVSEGDFLKVKSGDTFFLQGSIDNTAGKITGISAAKLKGSGSGTGTLLLVTFKAKAAGETRVTLSNFYAGSSSGEGIPSDAPEIVITLENRKYPAWDVNQDGQVNVLDLILVAQYLGGDAASNPQADVNGDGIINILDLIVVAQYFGESTETA
ncbi:MAG: leucine-rich repeat domain-containing protein, partial [Candidatus Poribacteria bacterium]|nr:leucine-rich repeat domain-containing protein [Candidatus Poribacteria bacterium]